MKILYQFVLATALALASSLAFAGDTQAGSLRIENPRVRVTIANRPGAGYMVIHNMSDEADRIISASSPMADRVELHTHLMKDGIMRMRKIDGVDVPAKGQAEFAPSGNHLMLFGLKAGVKEAGKLPVTLVFEKAGEITLDFMVEGAGDAMKHDNNMEHMKQSE